MTAVVHGASSRRLRTLGRHVVASEPAGCGVLDTQQPEVVAAPLELRRSGPLRVDEIMMGCAFIEQRQQATATIAAALEAGISAFDTAAAYGGSEVALGRALAAAGPAANQATVITKVRGDPGSEPRFEELDQSAAAAHHTLAVSKEAMGLEKIHTIRFHDPDDARIDAALKPDGLLAGLRELRTSGQIQHGLAGCSIAWSSFAQRAATASHSAAYAPTKWKS